MIGHGRGEETRQRRARDLASMGTEPKIRYNKWRGEGEGEGEGAKDELAATIRL